RGSAESGGAGGGGGALAAADAPRTARHEVWSRSSRCAEADRNHRQRGPAQQVVEGVRQGPPTVERRHRADGVTASNAELHDMGRTIAEALKAEGRDEGRAEEAVRSRQ